MTKAICGAIWTLILLGAVTAKALTCTDLPAIPGSAINCTSSGNCFAKVAGAACGTNQQCVPYARRLFSACCTCPTPGSPNTTATLRCVAAQTKAETKFMACHVSQSAKTLLRGTDPDYGPCVAKLQTTLAKVDARYGAACPQGSTAGVLANTYAAVLGQMDVDPATVLLCAPPAQWNPVQQLCVASCS